MVYHYTDGFLTVPKTNAVKAWLNFDEVKIGYQNKDNGAYWTPDQFININDAQYSRRKQIPHTRIKYIIKESVYMEQEK